MRLLIFSDIHGNQYAWRAFLQKIEHMQYDVMAFLGDIFGYYYAQDEIITGLCLVEDLIWLKGNHDQLFLDLLDGKEDLNVLTEHYGHTYEQAYSSGNWMREIIALRPTSYELVADEHRILFCHGTPSNPLHGRCYPRDMWGPSDCGPYDIVFCGHTHFRMVRQSNNKLWINVGSLGQPRDGNRSGALLFESNTCEFEYVDITYDKAPLFEEIQQKDPYLPKLKDILKRERES